MQGVYKRKKSRFWWISYAGTDGNLIRESAKSERKADAEALLRQRKMEVDEGRNPHKKPVAKITLKVFATEYLKTKELKQKSFDRTERAIKQLTDYFGNKYMNSFTYALVDDWKRIRCEGGNREATVNRYLAILKNMFKIAMKRRKVSRDAYEEVASVELYKLNNERFRYLSIEECQRLIDECSGHLRPIVIVAIYTGLRRGEILNLKWHNVDFQNDKITLDASMTKDSDIRTIDMLPEVRKALSAVERSPHIAYVFHDEQGHPYKDVRTSFENALKRAKINDFHFHDLRTTFGSQFMMAGGNIKSLQEILGHQSLKMTQRYAKISDSHKKNEMQNLSRRLSNGGTHSTTHRNIRKTS